MKYGFRIVPTDRALARCPPCPPPPLGPPRGGGVISACISVAPAASKPAGSPGVGSCPSRCLCERHACLFTVEQGLPYFRAVKGTVLNIWRPDLREAESSSPDSLAGDGSSAGAKLLLALLCSWAVVRGRKGLERQGPGAATQGDPPQPAASTPPGNLLEMQCLRPHPGPPRPKLAFLTNSPGDFYAN